MGLDIRWFSGLRLADPQPKDDCDVEGVNTTRLYLNNGKDFPGRADEIQDGMVYTFENSDGFRAGSYGGYNVWRDQLAQLAGYASARAVWNDPKPGPFVDLINFSDCEGTLGTAICMKLSQDFAQYQEVADAHPDDYFRQKYTEWRQAFDEAAVNGCVRFH